ncbi:MAG TPA: thioredoxin domain-containing protein [Bacillota bacterium]|nr:thioredoxin domain-containing protein [Bacillota bacterium]
MSHIKNVHTDSFNEEVIESDQLVLISFHTDGCGPCKAMEPILEELSVQYKEKLKIATFYVSLDEVLENSNKIAVEYDVMGFPTILIMKNGNVVNTLLGGQSKEDLVKEIEVALS